MLKSSKILVTGAPGFVGTHLISRLVKQGYEVYALERYVTGRYILGEKREIKTVFGDLREAYTIKRIIREVQPDVLIHLASISPVTYSYNHPQEVMEANFLGTINLAEACLHEIPHFKQFLFASTSETYGNGPNPKMEETTQMPNSPYAISKVASEKYLLYMRDAYNFPITILRNFNTYGRKNNYHFVVERTILQMLTEKTVKLGDPTPIRDFVFIEDHVNAYLDCLDNPKSNGEIFNFCTGRGISIRQLIELLSKLTDFEGEVFWNTMPNRPLDIKELVGDYGKAKRLLDWEPKYTLEEGLKLTIDYWKNKISNSRCDTDMP